MKQMIKSLPYIFLAFLLVVGSSVLTNAYARSHGVKRVSIKTCKACRGIANELEDALYERDNLKQILKNWERRYNGLSKQLGTVKELKAKMANASGDAYKDLEARMNAVKTAKDKVDILRGKVRAATANAARWQGRFSACHEKHCKGEPQGGRAIGMGGYQPTGLRKASTTCKPCQKIVDKLNRKYLKIYNLERQLARQQMRLENMLSRYGTPADLKHNINKLWSAYTAAKGAAKKSLKKKWQKKSDQAGEIADLQEQIALDKSIVKSLEADAKKLNAQLIHCVNTKCPGEKPKFGYIPGYGGSGEEEHAYVGLGGGYNVSRTDVDTTETAADNAGAVTTESASQRNHGASGTAFLGYQIPIGDSSFFANLEAGVVVNTVSSGSTTVAGVDYGRVGIQNSVWGSVNPGVHVSPITDLYARIGAAAGRLVVNEGTGTFHKEMAGLLTGAGIQTVAGGGYDVRVEYDHVDYQKYEGNLTGNGRTETFNSTSDQVMVSVVKKIAV